MSAPLVWALAAALWLGCLLPGPWWLAPPAPVLLGMLAAVPLPPVRRAAAAALVLACAGSGLAGAREHLADDAVLARLAEERAQVTLAARAVSDARRLPGGGAWQLLAATSVDGEPVRERLLARWPSGARRSPPLGAAVTVEASLRPLGRDGFDGHARGLHAVAAARVEHVLAVRPPPRLLAVTEAARRRAATAMAAGLPPQPAALLAGMTLGDLEGARLPRAVEERFDRAGLTHLVVVSGGQVALVAAAVLALGRLVGAGFTVRRLAALAAVAWYVLLARPEPPLLRAGAAAALLLGAQLAGRRADPRRALGVVVLVLLLADPALARQAGFALSVAAAAAVLVATGPLAARLPGARVLRRLVAAALAAQLAVAPLLLATFDALPLLALPANLVALPAAGLAQTTGLAAAALAQASPRLGAAAAFMAGPPLRVVLGAADRFGSGPVLTRASFVPPGVAALLPGRLPPRVDALALTALDVGQGDALVVEAPAPGGVARALVDAGPDPRRAARLLRRLGVRRLDLAVLTHGDLDHAGGMPGVLEAVQVGALVVGPVPASVDSAAARAALDAAAARGVPVVRVHAGHRVWLGQALLEILGPPRSGFPGAPANEHSLVIRVHGPGGRMLLTGDVEVLGQLWLLGRPGRLRAEVLKVPHHGGDTNADGFLEAVGASVAVLSVGRDNRYGHPHPDVLAALRGARVLRTDFQGTLRHSLSGNDGLREERSDVAIRRVEPRDPGRAGGLPGPAAGPGSRLAHARGVARALRRSGRVLDHGARDGRQHRHVPRQPFPPRPVRGRRQRPRHRHGRGTRRGRARRHRRRGPGRALPRAAR